MIFQPLAETNSRYGAASREKDVYDYPAGPAMTRLWMDGFVTTAEFGREVLRLIEQDVANGTVPWDVYDYSELHNFVDANGYTLEVVGFDGSGYGTDLTSEVQDWVAVALRGSRPSSLDFGSAWHDGRRFNHREWTPAAWTGYVAGRNRASTTAGSAPPVKFDDFLPVTEVQAGDCLVGGVVTGIRKSKSGRSIWFTMLGARGEREWPRESAHVRTMVFSRGNPLTSWDDALKPGTEAWEMPDEEQVNMTAPAPAPAACRDARAELRYRAARDTDLGPEACPG